MIDVIGIALLTAAVLIVFALGPWLIAALVARRRQQPDLVLIFMRRASTSAFTLGGLAIVFAVVGVLLGSPLTAARLGLVVAGLLLFAAGATLRRWGFIS